MTAAVNSARATPASAITVGSAKEVDTFLQLLVGAGVVDKAQTTTALELFDQVRAMTWRLLNPKG